MLTGYATKKGKANRYRWFQYECRNGTSDLVGDSGQYG